MKVCTTTLSRAIYVAAILLSLTTSGCDKLLDRRKIRKGDELVKRIEQFRERNHRLPDNFEEAGATDPEATIGFYYMRCDKDSYIIWFGTSLGESVSYSSTGGTWNSVNLTCRETHREAQPPTGGAAHP